MGNEIDVFLDAVRVIVVRDHIQLVDLFDVFADEARFGRRWLADSLSTLNRGDPILEVGAGMMLLSCQLCREGFDVTAIEPLGDGFTGFHALQKIVLEYATTQGCVPKLHFIPIESFDASECYVFAYSINVMEHVGSVVKALHKVASSLAPGGRYRFTCPNYLFPYEPHFNIPTLFSKKLTEWFFSSAIRGNVRMDDPVGLWRSLNWIDVAQIRRACRSQAGIAVFFRRSLLVDTLNRVVTDGEFAGRRSYGVRVLAKFLVRTGLHRTASLIPSVMQPIIDCEMVKRDA